MINAKKKGNRGENDFANWLNDNNIKAWKDGASGGGTREKADVGNNINAHFEVKTVKGINLFKVWKKAVFECNKTHNTPYIVIHFDGMPKNEWLMVLHSEDWLDLYQGQVDEPIIKEVEAEDSRDKKWAIQNAITSLKKLLKFYNNTY